VTPTSPLERAQPTIPEPRPIVVAKPQPKPRTAPKPPGVKTTGRSISGLASWYCRAGQSPCTNGYPDVAGVQAYAAAGPRLRAAIGSGWRGRIVTVNGMQVKLIDWCQCYQGQSNEKLLDLYYDVFSRVGSKVTITW